jgi:hypothetical protein
MTGKTPEELAGDLVDMGFTIEEEPAILPDGSGFMLASLPLPKNHWLYRRGYNTPPMPLRMGSGPERDEMVKHVWAAGEYAVRAATMNGQEDDFDPDAMVQNFVVGLLGYFTKTGASDAGENPDPLPPLFRPTWKPEGD